MRTLPIFIMVGLAFIAVIGVIILQTASTAAIVEINNSSTEELPLTIYYTEYFLMFGFVAILILLGLYFSVHSIIR